MILISDEVHCDFVWKGRQFISVSQLVDGKGVVTIMGFGKTFNMASLCPANIIITDEKLLPEFRKKVPYMQTNPLTVAATIAACKDSDQWLHDMREYVEGNIDAVLDFLETKMPQVKCLRPEGGYMLWMDFRKYGLSDEEIHHRIYGRAGVILEDGIAFDSERGQGFQRACVPSPRKRVLEAFERIAKEFSGL